MTETKRYQSPALRSLHEAREDLHDVGAAFDLLVESFGLFDQIFCQCAFGNAVNARTSVLASPSMAAIRVRHVETWAVSLADPGAVHHTILR